MASGATTVMFDSSFKDVKPVTLYKWFNDFGSLSSIIGIENLNTSEVTNMFGMFTSCDALTSINLSTFDMSNVTDVGGMFTACTNLSTIYCNKTWPGIANSDDMFLNTNLKGYSSSSVDISMANPFTGYFTMTPVLSGAGTEGDPYVITDAAQWDALGNYVAAGNNCYGLYFKLGRDITVNTCIGSSDKYFSGTFIGGTEGNQHVLTVDIDEGANYYAAPFSCIYGATIKNVYVKGTVKGGRHAAGLVGCIKDEGYASILDCRVATTVITTDQYAGGIVGHGFYTLNPTLINGCLFEGTIKRESSGGLYAGAIVGWCDNIGYLSINDCVEKGTYTNFTNTNLNYCNNDNRAQAFGNSSNYNFHKWSAGKQALEIELDDDDVLKPARAISQRSYFTSSISAYEGGAMSYLPEPEDDDDLLVFAAADNTFYFNLTGGTLNGVTDEDGNDVSYSGSDPYYFTMPAKSVKVSADEGKAYVFQIGSSKLVFAYSESPVSGTWKGETITAQWSGNAVKNVGWSKPGWVNSDNQSNITIVVFDESFAQVKPKSMNRWFMEFAALNTIEGIEYLNTSECTNMNSMFYSCDALTSINVNNFDVSEVTNASAMFQYCTYLETITCNNAWDIATTEYMFSGCSMLRNYDSTKIEGDMANPDTGYFTETAGDSDIQGRGSESDPYLIGTARQWQKFAENVNNGNSYDGYYVRLTADINIGNTMVGTIEADGNNITGGNQFKGYFDGNGHTITMALSGASGELAVAPFRNVDARISNLRVSGTISTSGKFAGSIVGRATFINMTNCYSDVAITSTVSGDGTIGGLIGIVQNPYGSYYSYECPIEGCVFAGKLLGSSTTHCGGFIGWVNIYGIGLTIRNSLFAPAETTFGTSNCQTFVRSGGGSITSTQYADVENCYYTATLGTAQGAKVYEITDETGAVMPYNNTYYGTCSMFVGGNMLMMFGDGFKYYGASGETVQFTSSLSTTAKKTANSTVVTLNGVGSDASPYSFTMPAEAVTLSSEAKPYAIWCNDNKTLYFVTTGLSLTTDFSWDGRSITNLWSGNDVTKTGWNAPGWLNDAKSATTVVFDPSFANVKPNSLYKWFYQFSYLTTITGIENLNTSEVTVMNSTFANCIGLKTIDVNGFDVSKVTNSTTMFRNCSQLTTIYCENTWNIESSTDMFTNCSNLVGGVRYNAGKINNSTLANPLTGYFTWNKSLALEDNANNSSALSANNGTSGMTVTLNGRTFYQDGDWNTVCLPFDLNGANFIASPFVSAISIMELDTDGDHDGHKTGFDASTGTLYLYFKDVIFDDDTTDETNYGDGMLAGVPYLVKWGNEGTTITNPIFNGVTINATAPQSVVASNIGLNDVTFQGTYSPVSYETEDKSVLFLGTANNLYYPDGTSTTNIKAFRAYFQIELGEASGVKSFMLNFGEDDEATAIKDLNDLKDLKDAIYNLAGQRLQKMQRGINIVNGKKVLK